MSAGSQNKCDPCHRLVGTGDPGLEPVCGPVSRPRVTLTNDGYIDAA